jgi:2-phosphoglycerate kinase
MTFSLVGVNFPLLSFGRRTRRREIDSPTDFFSSKRSDLPGPFVLLIGGSSSVGKTTASATLAARLGVPHLELDVTLARGDPRLDPLAGPTELWDRPPSQLCDLLIGGAEAAMPFVDRQVTACAGGAVIEGERIHPALIARLAAARRARGVLIIEADAARLHDTLMARSRGFRKISEPRRHAVAEVDRLYGQWLSVQATTLAIPCLSSQPWETLADRVLDACMPGDDVNEWATVR